MYTLNESSIKQYYDNFGECKFMNFFSLSINKLQLSQHLDKLLTLNLSHNRLKSVKTISCCINLQKLDLSYNHISDEGGIAIADLLNNANNLLSFNIQGNDI